MSNSHNLTPKQEHFVIVYIKTGNASEAYRQAYSEAAGRSNESSINRSAKQLIDNPKIITRLAELRKPAAKAAQVTLIDHLNELKELRDLAKSSEKYDAAIKAECARGKVSGLYVDKIEHSGSVGIADAILAARARAK